MASEINGSEEKIATDKRVRLLGKETRFSPAY
jgi:hypothetical protein